MSQARIRLQTLLLRLPNLFFFIKKLYVRVHIPPTMPRKSRPLTTFYSHVSKNTSTKCWDWTGEINWGGYGRFMIRKKHYQAHRFSYGLFKGAIPEGYELDHLCRNRSCVNPDHLEAVTRSTNLRRGHNYNRDKTHCPKGHLYSGENLLIRTDTGSRRCRECIRQQKQEWRDKNRETLRSYHREYMRKRRALTLV
jgi:hypothetical protein